MRLTLPLLLLLLVLLYSCREAAVSTDPGIDYARLPATEADAINVVVEIPAGTNHKIEFRHEEQAFVNDSIDGRDRVIDFLPYPGNYGFIPATLVEQERGGDGDALDVLVIGESRPTGAVVKALPIGALLLLDRGEIDTKIIAVPRDSTERVLQAANFLDFMLRHDAARRIVEDWFLNYKGPEAVQLVRWEDEQYAWSEIRRWKKDPVVQQ